MTLSASDLANAARVHNHDHGFGHGGLTRRQFLGVAAGGAALVVAGPLVRPARTANRVVQPKPIPGSALPPYHFYFPAYKEGGPPAVFEQSSVTDFKGAFASTDVFGSGKDQADRAMSFRCDMRIMEGTYVGVDGAQHHGTFGFI